MSAHYPAAALQGVVAQRGETLRGLAARPGEHVGEFFEQDRAAVELQARMLANRLQQPIRIAAPQQRGHHHVGIKNDPHRVLGLFLLSARASFGAHGLDLGVDLFLAHGFNAGGFQRRGDGQEPIEGRALLGLGGQEINEIFYFRALLRGQRLELVEKRSFVGAHVLTVSLLVWLLARRLS